MKIKSTLILAILLMISSNLYAQYIPKIAPVDVYGNLKNIGFQTKKDLGSDLGNFWISTDNSGGIKYKVEVESDNASNVKSIRATAMNASRNKVEVKQFLKYVGSFLFFYRDSGKSNFNNWVDDHFNNGGKTMVGQVKIEIKAPSEMVRIMYIKAN